MKRRSYVRHDAEVELRQKPLMVWGYGRTGRFVCRVEINSAGVAVFSGRKGNKKLADASWERLVERLAKSKK